MLLLPGATLIVPFLKVMVESFSNWKPLLSVPAEPAPGSFSVYVFPLKSRVKFFPLGTETPTALSTLDSSLMVPPSVTSLIASLRVAYLLPLVSNGYGLV